MTARAALSGFRNDVARVGGRFSVQVTPFEALFHTTSPIHKLYDVLSRFLSPYQPDPFGLNPLRDILRQHVDFEAVRAFDDIRLFVSAAHLSTGQPSVFRNRDVTLESVLASACLPLLFHAAEIADEAYWDGGYSSNPALLPLVADSAPDDLVLVQITPVTRPAVPRTAQGIIDPINEISCNSSLNHELLTLALLKQLLREEAASGHSYHTALFGKVDALCMHRIEADKELASLGGSTRLSVDGGLVQRLHAVGRDAADAWLRRKYRHLRRSSTIDFVVEAQRNAQLATGPAS